MLPLRLIDPSTAIAGIAFALLAVASFIAARRLHAGFFVACAGFVLAAVPKLALGVSDALAWFGSAQTSPPQFVGTLFRSQAYFLLVAALAVMWSTVVLLRQDRPNISLKRTNQSLRD